MYCNELEYLALTKWIENLVYKIEKEARETVKLITVEKKKNLVFHTTNKVLFHCKLMFEQRQED